MTVLCYIHVPRLVETHLWLVNLDQAVAIWLLSSKVKCEPWNQMSFFSSWRVQLDLSKFWLLTGLLKVLQETKNFGQFDDKTLFQNKSNLHTKIAFIHNISHRTHNVRPVVSIRLCSPMKYTKFAQQKLEIWQPKQWKLMHDASKLISLLSPSLNQDWEHGQYHFTCGSHERCLVSRV